MAIRPIPADRDEWLALRKPSVTASEVAAILGEQAEYQLSPLALYYIKRGEIEPPDINSERIEWGQDFEDAIARVACRREGWSLRPGVFAVDDECHGSAATLDRVVHPSSRDEDGGFVGPGALEVKNVDFIAYRDKWINDEPPGWILLQLQDQLACTGFQWGAVTACVAGNEYYCRRYMRHEGVIAAIRKAKTDFWAAVRDGRPPRADHRESTTAALRQVFRKITHEVVDLSNDNELPGLFDKALALAAQRKATDREEEETKNLIRAKLGGGQKALLADGRVITRSVSPDTPDRPAEPGEVIRGRRGADRLTFSKTKAKTGDAA